MIWLLMLITTTFAPQHLDINQSLSHIWQNLDTLPPSLQSSTEAIASSSFLNMCDESSYNALPTWTAAVLLITILIALAYMLGTAFNLPQFISFAKEEINELFFNVLLITFLFFFINAFQSSFEHDPFEVVTAYNVQMLSAIAGSIGSLTGSYVFLTAFQRINFTYFPKTLGNPISIRLDLAFKPIFDSLLSSLRLLLVSYGIWMTHLVLFCIIKKWFLHVFIPLALVLRVLPWTRPVGNALLSISLGLVLIYPFMFYINAKIYNTETLENGLLGGPFMFIKTLFKEHTFGAFLFSFTFLVLFRALGFITFIYSFLLSLLAHIMFVTVKIIFIYSLVLPIINIYTTFTFIREVGKWLGTELSVTALLRLI